jgi:hypothetical protein
MKQQTLLSYGMTVGITAIVVFCMQFLFFAQKPSAQDDTPAVPLNIVALCSPCTSLQPGAPTEPLAILLDQTNGDMWQYSYVSPTDEPTYLGKLILGQPIQR